MHDLLATAAARWPDRPAAETLAGARLTYAELNALAAGLAGRLAAAGIGRGARVAVALPPSIDGLAALHGTLQSGAACVPLDPGAPPARLGAILADCEVAALVAEAPLAAVVPAPAGALVLAVPPGDGGGDGLRAAASGPAAAPTAPDDADLALIQFTSGSTGRPKGVMLSHANLRATLDWYAAAAAPGPEDRFVSHAPLQLSATLFNALLPARAGACVLLVDELTRRSPRDLVRAVSERGITIWMCAPSVQRLLLDHGAIDPRVHRLPRLLLSGGEALPPRQALRLRELFPATTVRGLYASTETSGCTLFEPPTDDAAPATIGRPAFGVDLQVVDETGAPVTGVPGEIRVSGPAVTVGYWRAPALDAEAFVVDAAGRRWFRTRDLGLRRADGAFTWLGRLDRTVKRRGYRVALEEIEACLRRHPALAEAAVVAVADAGAGLRLVASFVTPAAAPPSVVELKLHCAAALPSYMIPDRFVRLPALPRTTGGKIDLQALAGAAS
jgi:amino acid adenylation domain-containing protein